MKIFVTYGDSKYAVVKNFAVKMSLKYGNFDKSLAYSPDDIDESFKEKNKEILSIKRGAGLWLWKPYIIMKALKEEANYGDYVFYSDSGSFFLRPVDNLIKSMKDDIWVSNIPLYEWQFTHPTAMSLMKCHEKEYKETAQIQATYVCIRKSNRSIAFIEEWLNNCCKYDIISPYPKHEIYKLPKGFIAHREDQSILSLLSKKWKINPHQDPSQLGKIKNFYICFDGAIYCPITNAKEYKPLIVSHRRRSIYNNTVLKMIIWFYIPSVISETWITLYRYLKNTKYYFNFNKK